MQWSFSLFTKDYLQPFLMSQQTARASPTENQLLLSNSNMDYFVLKLHTPHTFHCGESALTLTKHITKISITRIVFCQYK